MGVRNIWLRLIARRTGCSILAGLCLLAVLLQPATADSGRDLTVLDTTPERQTMGFEHLRNAPALTGYGITMDLIGQPILPLLNGAAAMRLHWIRQPVRWADLEPAPGVYSWESLDRVVTEVRTRGFHLLLVIDGTPAWARSEHFLDSADGPPVYWTTLVKFLHDLSARYAGLVDAYQIWQSPNLAAHWDGAPDPQNYADLLRLSAHAIKATDPGALVVSGDLFLGDLESRPGSLDGLEFLREMMQSDLAAGCDALALAIDPSSPVESLTAVHDVVGPKSETPIWITRAGWSCPPEVHAGIAVCEDQQAAYLIDLAGRVARLSWVQTFIVDNFNLSIVDQDHPAAGKSLVRSDWSPRPAFLEYARIRQEQATNTGYDSTAHFENRAPQSGPKPDRRIAQP